jgi:hypothetical protein
VKIKDGALHMPSRLSLSALAAIFGATVFYFLIYYNVLPVPENKAHPLTDAIVGVAALAVAIGWYRIFRRRPGGPTVAPGED